MNKQQSGFAVVESLLILVIVAIIGGTGWFVWHSKQQTDKTLSETGNSQAVNPSKKTPTTVSTST
jgi:type II secretory pathway component PulJ